MNFKIGDKVILKSKDEQLSIKPYEKSLELLGSLLFQNLYDKALTVCNYNSKGDVQITEDKGMWWIQGNRFLTVNGIKLQKLKKVI